jgi:formylmethanofuran dehydrogenase subunit E
MESFEELLRRTEAAHGHLCAGLVLGVRMAKLALSRLGIADPKGEDRKRLIVYVEIDRCATDAIGIVTGCKLSKRTLKFLDWGKMAATFVDLETGRAIRIVALETSRELAAQLHPEIEDANKRQMAAFRELADAQMFTEQWVRVAVGPRELPGYRGKRIDCALCGEGINFDRFEEVGGERLCLSCARPERRYWEPASSHD